MDRGRSRKPCVSRIYMLSIGRDSEAAYCRSTFAAKFKGQTGELGISTGITVVS